MFCKFISLAKETNLVLIGTDVIGKYNYLTITAMTGLLQGIIKLDYATLLISISIFTYKHL